MGYTPPRKRVRLRFPHHQGLEVVAKSVPLGTFLAITSLAESAGTEAGTALDLGAAMEAMGDIEELFSMFADALVEWNVEDEDGNPVPATLAGLRIQDVGFCLEILRAWMEAIGGVSAPLVPPSAVGGQSLEASMPMDLSSGSQAS